MAEIGSQTLDAFISEASLPPDAGSSSKESFTIEKLLDEKRAFDLSAAFEKFGTDDDTPDAGWTGQAPGHAVVLSSLPATSNVLHLSFQHSSSAEQRGLPLALLATTADRRLSVIQLPSLELKSSTTTLSDSPILSTAALDDEHSLLASMSGQLTLVKNLSLAIDRRRDHTKYIVRVATYKTSSCRWLATAAWDGQIRLYQLSTVDAAATLPEPTSTIHLTSNPEAMQFIPHPDSPLPILIVTRRDSSFLSYYSVSTQPRLLGKQNLAPHSNAWVAFTPSDVVLCPTDPTLLAVATSAVPHMKLVIVRLLIPPASSGETSEEYDSPAAQGRAELARQDREAAAIHVSCSTLAPQTPYSTPSLAWRPDGSGVWVNSDDGMIRGFEARTGKHITTLKGHDVGSKIRCLASAYVDVDGKREEWLASGGFDQKLIIWKPKDTVSGPR